MSLVIFLLIPYQIPKNSSYSLVVYTQNGNLLGAKVANDGQWRLPHSYTKATKYHKCLIAFEDKNFYSHLGIDFKAIGRASILLAKNRKIKSGASTITMQMVRMHLKLDSRSMYGKIKQILYAINAEIWLSKSEILAQYCTYAPYGGNVVGIDAASWRYFNKNISELTWAESALLAVLPNRPSQLHPRKADKKLIAKRNLLLKTLFHKNIITAQEYKLSVQEELTRCNQKNSNLYSHVVEKTAKDFPQGGKIILNINDWLQESCVNILNRHKNQLWANGIKNAGILIMDIKSQKVLTYIGNHTPSAGMYFQNYVDMINAPRSTGSLLKPLLFAFYLNEGLLLNQALVEDYPIYYGNYSPKNYELEYDGAISFKKALAKSLNVPFVKLLHLYGIERFHQNLQKMGMNTLNFPASHYGLSLILGGAEGSLWEMLSIYANMAKNTYYNSLENEVFAQKPNLYFNIKPNLISKNQLESIILSRESTYQTLEAMALLTRGEEEMGWQFFKQSSKISWKTGTSFGNKDAWAMGITPCHAVGIWIGNSDGEGKSELTGLNTASPILFEVFKLLKCETSGNEFVITDSAWVCAKSGYQKNENCEKVLKKAVCKKGLDSPLCPYCRKIFFDPSGKFRATKNCFPNEALLDKSVFVLPPTMSYYFEKKNLMSSHEPSLHSKCRSNFASETDFELVYPIHKAKIFIPKALDGIKSKVVFQASSRDKNAILYWYIDQKFIAQTSIHHQIEISPGYGEHILSINNSQGKEKIITFEILERNKKEKF